jgi:tetratricopeptide (TPR) repeat protein
MPFNAAAPNGSSKKAVVSEQVGLTLVTITYHRPAVNGREGRIWEGVVHKGFKDLGFGHRKPAPWRAGANENTIIEWDQDVLVEGQPLPKGRYGLFIAYDPLESTIIFSKRSDAWGSFFYDDKEDALRVKVKPQSLEKSIEYLQYEFTRQTPNSAVITLSWEKQAIPFRVEVDYLKQQWEAFVTEAQHPQGFSAQGLTIAANWALQNNYGLEKALEWATAASGTDFPGDPTSFSALSIKAALLFQLGRSAEATGVLRTALPLGNVGQLQQYGRQLIAAKQPKAALEVFRFNFKQAPDQFITLTGMARGLSATGDYAKALEYALKAVALAPNASTRDALGAMVEKLKAGKDIN